jgi:hypothetical protein
MNLPRSPGSADAASVFADFAAGLDFGRIPPAAVECTKKLVIDQIVELENVSDVAHIVSLLA